MASATEVSGSDTVDSASTRVVPGGTPCVRRVTASPLVQTPSSTPMPTEAAAAQTSIQPCSCTFTEHTSGLPDPEVAPVEHGLDAPARVRLDPAPGGDADLHVGHLGPDRRDRVAHVHRVEGLVRVGVARVHVHGGDAEPGDRPGVPGEVPGQHGKRRVCVSGPGPVEHRLQHRKPPPSGTHRA